MTSISYVIPTLNSAKTLEATLLGLSYQQDVNVSITVVDSGSTDATLDICRKWGIKAMYAEPGNIYRAINVGLRACSTDWLGYINSDDWIYPNSLKRLLQAAISSDADFIYGNCDFTDASGRFMYTLLPANPSHLLNLFRISGLGFTQQATIFRRECYEKLSGFDENFYLSGDKDFFARAMLTGLKFVYLSGSPIACFRLHSNQLSQTKFSEMLLENKLIRERHLGNPGFIDYLVFLKWRFYNFPQYLVRFIRQSSMANKLGFARSMSSGFHRV